MAQAVPTGPVAPGPTAAAVSFALVMSAGVALLTWRAPVVDRAVDRTADASPLTPLYGLAAFGLVVVVGALLVSQAATVGLGGPALRLGGTVLVAAAVVCLAAFGYLVVGTSITGLWGPRQPWVGAVVGAVLSAVPVLVLPRLPGLAAWLLVAALGLGAPTRHYVHEDRGDSVTEG